MHPRLELLAERRKILVLARKGELLHLRVGAVISGADCWAPRQLVDLGLLGCDRRGGVGRRCMSVMVWAHNLSKLMQ